MSVGTASIPADTVYKLEGRVGIPSGYNEVTNGYSGYTIRYSGYTGRYNTYKSK